MRSGLPIALNHTRSVLSGVDFRSYHGMYYNMNKKTGAEVRRVTANLPAKLLEDACESTGRGLTETLTLGLEMVRRATAAAKAKRLKGKVRLDLDLEASRERTGH